MGPTLKEGQGSTPEATNTAGRHQPAGQRAEKYHGNPAKIIETLTAGITLLKENAREGARKGKPRLEAKDLAALANRPEEDIDEAMIWFSCCYGQLSDEKFRNGRDLLLDNAAVILSHETGKISQLYECICMFDADQLLHGFMATFIKYIDENIYWPPCLNKLLSVENIDAITAIVQENELEKYAASWSESVVMYEQAEREYGLGRIPSLETGLNLNVVVWESEGYATEVEGGINIPPFEHTFETKGENFVQYLIGIFHELGHHKWGTFRINIDPQAFDYGAFGLEYASHWRNGDGNLEVIAKRLEAREGEERTVRITSFEDIIKLVKYPLLLIFLHNVIDDGRVDANNIMEYPGLAGKYRRNTESLLEKRPRLEDVYLQTLLEAILQYAITGKTMGEIPAGLKERFQQAKYFIDRVECGPETNGTASLNSAMRIYLLLERELEDEIKRMKESEVPNPMRNSKTKVGGSGSSPQLVRQKPKKGRRGRPGVNPLQFANPKEENRGEGNQSGGQEKPKPGKGKPGSKTGEGEDETDKEPGKKSGTQAGGKEDEESDEGDGQPQPGNRGNVPKGAEDEEEDEPKVGNDEPGSGKKTFVYDGFNGEKYTRKEHVITEVRAEGAIVVPDMREVERVARIFKRYAPKRGELVRGLEEGDIDPELLRDYLRELRCGRIPERAFYSRVVYEERDVGFGGLVDLSGSTEKVREALIRAMNTLDTASETCRDPFIVGGFTTGQDGKGEIYVSMKEAHERGIRNSKLCGNTPIGGPIRHMCYKMEGSMRTKGHKHMFVATDGGANVCRAPRPLGKENGGKGVDIPVVDAAMAVEEAWKKYHIRCSGIGIIYHENEREIMVDLLRQIFGIGNYLTVTDKQVYAGTLDRYFEGFYRKVANRLR